MREMNREMREMNREMSHVSPGCEQRNTSTCNAGYSSIVRFRYVASRAER